MFFFTKKSTATPDYSVLKTDIHSHLLPGIDDGAPDIDTSLLLIKGLQDLGFQRLYTTPHVMAGMYPNTPEIISERLSMVRASLSGTELEMPFDAAAEYFLDDHMEATIQADHSFLTLPGRYLLCEFSMLTPTMGLKRMIFDLQMKGYRVIIAHPERYVYLQSNKTFYDDLKDMGCDFQLNILSLGIHYGKVVQSLAQYLIKQGYYDFAATDLHHTRHLEMLRDPKIGEGLKMLMDGCPIRNTEIG
jgi:tyrosine-protein phosphatase YwqE